MRAFATAHFVALFDWSNLGAIVAIHGAAGIAAAGLLMAAGVAADLPLGPGAVIDYVLPAATASRPNR